MGLFDDVSEKHLRAVLVALCKDTDICTKALAMVDKIEKAEKDAMADSNVSESEPKLAICVRCEKAFSIDDNEDYDCFYHYGDLYPDEDGPTWDGHDFHCHGDFDTPENRKDYPEAFLWDCCDEVSTTEGCKMGRHRIELGEDSDSSKDSDSSEDFDSD
ncbi:hypothetical protein BBO_06749 [Beauveria brongniartii RCEF 3172]|uniref:C2H2-type domain-containing protein n=1 Tax=Beauveria brongniartii RCEF 3172 TaxID=1081107 RepID=A0A167ATY1_9HYPO|nr:hypothetical protein BBO_06749 [Beauveria brongniartii RCEF 3172]